MTVLSPRSLFPLEQRTWVTILLIGAGFGAVAAAAFFVAGYPLRGALTSTIPLVFAYSAAYFHRPTAIVRSGAAVLGNVLLVLMALGIAAWQLLRAFGGTETPPHSALYVVLAMSAVVHLAVVVVSCESLTRLLRGVRDADVGDDAWQFT